MDRLASERCGCLANHGASPDDYVVLFQQPVWCIVMVCRYQVAASRRVQVTVDKELGCYQLIWTSVGTSGKARVVGGGSVVHPAVCRQYTCAATILLHKAIYSGSAELTRDNALSPFLRAAAVLFQFRPQVSQPARQGFHLGSIEVGLEAQDDLAAGT